MLFVLCLHAAHSIIHQCKHQDFIHGIASCLSNHVACLQVFDDYLSTDLTCIRVFDVCLNTLLLNGADLCLQTVAAVSFSSKGRRCLYGTSS